MRLELDQEEIYEAIADYMRDRLKLDNTVNISIGLTNARAPRGHTAQVDITYPKSERSLNFTARQEEEDETPVEQRESVADGSSTSVLAAATGVNVGPTDDIFAN